MRQLGMRVRTVFLMALGGFGAFAAPLISPANAAEPQFLSENRDWSAYTYGSGDDLLCFIMTQPTRSQGDYTRRGDIHLMVSHRPGDSVEGEISFTTGYTFREGSTVAATVGSQNFEMITEGENAWTQSVEDDQRLIAAMKAGSTMTLVGFSSRGTRTTDTISLLGFTASMQAIDRACGV